MTDAPDIGPGLREVLREFHGVGEALGEIMEGI